MAIRDIVTMGYGNGVFSPGVNKLPTLGYSIGVPVAIPGPYSIESFDTYVPGAEQASTYVPGAEQVEIIPSE